MTDKIFQIISVVFFIVVLYVLFTRKGKNAFVTVGLGKIIKDFGDIGAESIKGLPQKVRLLQCERNGKVFFVLETNFLLSVQYTKISNQAAQNLVTAISSALNSY